MNITNYTINGRNVDRNYFATQKASGASGVITGASNASGVQNASTARVEKFKELDKFLSNYTEGAEFGEEEYKKLIKMLEELDIEPVCEFNSKIYDCDPNKFTKISFEYGDGENQQKVEMKINVDFSQVKITDQQEYDRVDLEDIYNSYGEDNAKLILVKFFKKCFCFFIVLVYL